MKNPVSLAGIEPATFLFIAQHLNHCATAVPPPYVHVFMYNIQIYILCVWMEVVKILSKTFSYYEMTLLFNNLSPLIGQHVVLFSYICTDNVSHNTKFLL
jgi:hypothetical protein